MTKLGWCDVEGWGPLYDNHVTRCFQHAVIDPVPLLFMLGFGSYRLYLITRLPLYKYMATRRFIAKCVLSLAMALLPLGFVIVDTVHKEWRYFSIVRIMYVSLHLVSWLLSLALMFREYQRGLPQNYVVRSWWVAEFVVSSVQFAMKPGFFTDPEDLEYEILEWVTFCVALSLAILQFWPNDFPDDVTLPYRVARLNAAPVSHRWSLNHRSGSFSSHESDSEGEMDPERAARGSNMAAALLSGDALAHVDGRGGSYGAAGFYNPPGYGPIGGDGAGGGVGAHERPSRSGSIFDNIGFGFGRPAAASAADMSGSYTEDSLVGSAAGSVPGASKGSTSLWEQWLDMEKQAGRTHDPSAPRAGSRGSEAEAARRASNASGSGGEGAGDSDDSDGGGGGGGGGTARRQRRSSSAPKPIPIGGADSTGRGPSDGELNIGTSAKQRDGGTIRIVIRNYRLPDKWSSTVLDAMGLEDAVRDADFELRVRTDNPRKLGGRDAWQVMRKYSHFEALHSALRRRLGATVRPGTSAAHLAVSELPEFPAVTHFVRAMAAGVAHSRHVDADGDVVVTTSARPAAHGGMRAETLMVELRRKLEHYIGDVVTDRSYRCQALYDFLEMEGAVVDHKRRLDLDSRPPAPRRSKSAGRLRVAHERRLAAQAGSSGGAGDGDGTGGAGGGGSSSDDDLMVGSLGTSLGGTPTAPSMVRPGTSAPAESSGIGRAGHSDKLSKAALDKAAELAKQLGDKYSRLGTQRRKSEKTRALLEKRLEELNLSEEHRELYREKLRRRQLRVARQKLARNPSQEGMMFGDGADGAAGTGAPDGAGSAAGSAESGSGAAGSGGAAADVEPGIGEGKVHANAKAKAKAKGKGKKGKGAHVESPSTPPTATVERQRSASSLSKTRSRSGSAKAATGTPDSGAGDAMAAASGDVVTTPRGRHASLGAARDTPLSTRSRRASSTGSHTGDAIIGSVNSEPDYFQAGAESLREPLAGDDMGAPRRHSADDADPDMEPLDDEEGDGVWTGGRGGGRDPGADAGGSGDDGYADPPGPAGGSATGGADYELQFGGGDPDGAEGRPATAAVVGAPFLGSRQRSASVDVDSGGDSGGGGMGGGGGMSSGSGDDFGYGDSIAARGAGADSGGGSEDDFGIDAAPARAPASPPPAPTPATDGGKRAKKSKRGRKGKGTASDEVKGKGKGKGKDKDGAKGPVAAPTAMGFRRKDHTNLDRDLGLHSSDDDSDAAVARRARGGTPDGARRSDAGGRADRASVDTEGAGAGYDADAGADDEGRGEETTELARERVAKARERARTRMRRESALRGTATEEARMALAQRMAGTLGGETGHSERRPSGDGAGGTGVDTSDHTVRLRRLRMCFSGAKAVEWLMDSREAGSRAAAVAMAQALLQDQLIRFTHRLLAGGISAALSSKREARRLSRHASRRGASALASGDSATEAVLTDFTQFQDSHMHLYQFDATVTQGDPTGRLVRAKRHETRGVELRSVTSQRPGDDAGGGGSGSGSAGASARSGSTGSGGSTPVRLLAAASAALARSDASVLDAGDAEWVMDGLDVRVKLGRADSDSPFDESGVTWYAVRVKTPDGSRWAVDRRYNEFFELRVQLKDHLKGLGFGKDILPAFPPKSYLKLDAAGLEARRAKLEVFLQGVVAGYMFRCPSLGVFLDPEFEEHMALQAQARQQTAQAGASGGGSSGSLVGGGADGGAAGKAGSGAASAAGVGSAEA